jgi:hypothetical protein
MCPEPDRDIPRKDEDAERDDTEGASRRDVLATLGRFAYVAPALTLLAEPGLAHANYGGVPNGGNGKGKGG